MKNNDIKLSQTDDDLSFDEWVDNMKKYGPVIVIGVGVATLSLFSTTTLALLTVAGSAAAYALKPKEIENWFKTHRLLLVGGLLGFGMLHTIPLIGAPLGILAGAWLGHTLQEIYDGVTQAGKKVANAADYVVQPYQKTKSFLGSLWNGIKNECHELWYADSEEDQIDDMDEDQENGMKIISNPGIQSAAAPALALPKSSSTDTITDLIVYTPPQAMVAQYQQRLEAQPTLAVIQNTVPSQSAPNPNAAPVAQPTSWWGKMCQQIGDSYQSASKAPRTII